MVNNIHKGCISVQNSESLFLDLGLESGFLLQLFVCSHRFLVDHNSLQLSQSEELGLSGLSNPTVGLHFPTAVVGVVAIIGQQH